MTENNEEHFVGKIAQKVIIEKDGKILLMQDPREERNIWELPGGRMNLHEDPKEAMKREFLEELGQAIEVHEVVYLQQFFQDCDDAFALVIVYNATLVSPDSPFVMEEGEVSEVGWFSKEEIVKLELYPEHKRALDVYFTETV